MHYVLTTHLNKMNLFANPLRGREYKLEDQEHTMERKGIQLSNLH